ncbi:type VI secretion system tip protein VgrG, partial [Achromobacter sp. NPDC058515]
VINAGGSGTTYNAGGITHATSGPYKVHSANVNYSGPKSQAGVFPDEPRPAKGNLELFNKYLNGRGISEAAFDVEDALGRVFKGTLDAQGFAAVSGAAPGPAKVSFGKDPNNPWEQSSFLGRKPWPAQAAVGVPTQIQALADELQAKAKGVQEALQAAQAASQWGQQMVAAVQAGPKGVLRTAGASLAQMGLPGATDLLKDKATPTLAKSLTG